MSDDELRRDGKMLIRVVSERTQLLPSSVLDSEDLVARCPLHPDLNSRALHVTPARALWYCFECQGGGDVIAFVQAVEGCTYREALDYLRARS